MTCSYLFLIVAFAACAISYPNRGHYPFAIALCKHADRTSEPITTTRVREFFTSAGSTKPGMYQFLREQSSGAVDLEGCIIGGWYKTAQTFATTATYSRQQRLNTCRDAAIAGGMVIPATHKFMALYNESPDIGAVAGPSGGVVLIGDNTFLGISLVAHEVLHTLGEPHSRLASDTAPPREYGDEFDVMSTANVHTMYNDGVYSSSGPSLCAPARDRLGWLPINRIYTPAPNAYHFPLRLTSLSRSTASTSGYLMARIPIYTPVGEPWAYYTIEFRTANTGFDQGLSALGPDSNGVVIHRINETDQANWLVYPRFPAFGKPFSWFYKAGDTFFDIGGGISIKVVTIDLQTWTADVQITATGNPRHEFYGPNTCRPGEVWREADNLDYTCVAPVRRSAVRNENALGPSRTQPNSLYCKQGFVWREAWPKDYVCVPYAARSLAQEESRRAYKVVANDFTSTTLFGAGPLGPVIP